MNICYNVLQLLCFIAKQSVSVNYSFLNKPSGLPRYVRARVSSHCRAKFCFNICRSDCKFTDRDKYNHIMQNEESVYIESFFPITIDKKQRCKHINHHAIKMLVQADYNMARIFELKFAVRILILALHNARLLLIAV